MIHEILSKIEEIVSKILPSLKSVFREIGRVELVPLLRNIANIMLAVAEVLGLGKTDIEDLGARAHQMKETTGKDEKDFETYDEYVKELQAFQLDPEKTSDIKTEIKIAHGIAVVINLIEEKSAFQISDFLPEIVRNSEYFTKERIIALMDSFIKADMAIRDLSLYLDSKLNGTKTAMVEDVIVQAEKGLAVNQGKTEQEIRDRVQELRR